MDITPKSKKPMNKGEVGYLVELIQNQPILTSKETNAATNKLKEDAWVSLTAAFNARCGSIPKQKEQLKLKWDNLKKAARKRSQQIRMNNIKTGGGKPDFIPPDEILEKVASTLGATCSGFEVPFGGDGIAGGSMVLDSGDGIADGSMVLDLFEEDPQEHCNNAATVQLPDNNFTPKRSEDKKRNYIVCDTQQGSSGSDIGAKLYGMPTMSKSLQNKGKKKIEDGRLKRNLAIEKYYNLKAEKLDLEIRLLKSQLAKEKENICQHE